MTRSAASIFGLLATAFALALTGCGGPASSSATPTPAAGGNQATTTPAAADVTPPPAPTGPAELRDAIYPVGAGVRPGTYVTTAPAGKVACYWARLRSFGQPDSIIDDGSVESGEPARVTVLETDRGFKVSNGCVWRAAAK